MLHQVADHRFEFAVMVARPLVDGPLSPWSTAALNPGGRRPISRNRLPGRHLDCPGRTAGRGRMDRENRNHGQTIKDIYVYLLVRDTRQCLCGDSTRRGTWR